MSDLVERDVSRIPQPREMRPNYWKAERIAGAIKKENESIEEFMDLLSSMDPQEDAGTMKQVNEIVAETKKHIEVLQKLMKAYDGNI